MKYTFSQSRLTSTDMDCAAGRVWKTVVRPSSFATRSGVSYNQINMDPHPLPLPPKKRRIEIEVLITQYLIQNDFYIFRVSVHRDLNERLRHIRKWLRCVLWREADHLIQLLPFGDREASQTDGRWSGNQIRVRRSGGKTG